jgi:hypothetical protein
VPQCADRVCGDDGCGGNCGVCAPGKLCSLSGKCLDHPCGLVSAQGQCSTKFSGSWCDQMHLRDFSCSGGLVCGWDAVLGRYSCVEEKPCTPSCLFPDGSPRECGDNGCWGSCGTCAGGWACQLGYCKPSVGAECSWIDATLGACFGTVRWFCAAAKLYSYDCLGKEGKNCGWKPGGAGGGSFSCIPF